MKNGWFLLLGIAIILTSCDIELREILVSGEKLEYKNDSTFEVEYFVSRLPIVVLETEGQEILDEPRISAKMGIIDN
ncbi:MAG: hypothetical protein ACI9LA_001515, partial [Bacteroidia bacterium]